MLDKFAKLIGIEPRLAEDALHSERAARHTLSRRSFFGGVAGAMAGAAIFSIPSEVEAPPGPFFGIDRAAPAERLRGVRMGKIDAVRFDALMKQLYKDNIVADLAIASDPFIRMLEKRAGLS